MGSARRRVRHALPIGVLIVVTVVQFLLGADQVVLGQLVIAPLVAAPMAAHRTTAGYGLLALVDAALLGVYTDQYSGQALGAQVVRLCGILFGTAVAVVASTVRLRQEERLRRLDTLASRNREALAVTEAIQRSLLTDPPAVAHLETAVRYLPASRYAEVGGDWYDAFPLPGGGTMLVIGDVTGHDAPAAATMAQARGMLRGIAQTGSGSPAAVLAAVDRALDTLAMSTLVTAVVAVIDRPDGSAIGPEPDGSVRLRWSNAGHPPPVLVCGAGSAHPLERPAELLLGVDPASARTDHELLLQAGDSVLFFTDGLVERRRVPLDEGTAWLVSTLTGTQHRPLEQVLDDLLTELAGRVDDDVALLGVRVPGRG